MLGRGLTAPDNDRLGDREMGVEALTLSEDGTDARPVTDDDWRHWVSATRTRHYVGGDPILDWLDLYGEKAGFRRDPDLPGYDERTDFTPFIFDQGTRFEDAVVDLLRATHSVHRVGEGPGDARSLARAQQTFDAMCEGVPIIYQAVLWDAQHRTYGVPDLLVRSDALRDLFTSCLDAEEATLPAPDLPSAPWHYRVVDIKFRTLALRAGGGLGNTAPAPASKVQLFIYNRALGRLQGLEPPTSYLLGRGWAQGKSRGSSCLDRLAPVQQSGTLAGSRPIGEAVAEAVQWVGRVRNEGAAWRVVPEPTVPELYPNTGNQRDWPWHAAKKQIAERLEDLTELWGVGARGRGLGHDAGIYRWTDPKVTPDVLGVTPGRRSLVLDGILQVNAATEGPAVSPGRVRAARDEWHRVPSLEFYVDFETVSDLADDFSRLPEKGGQPLIFMIGCGHVESGRWAFESFVVDQLSENQEARIIDRWLGHMESVRRRLDPDGEPPVLHWSNAERGSFETQYNSAKRRHDRPDWPSPRWFDLLTRVMREEPVVVRGALNFGLKTVAKAMHSHGLIDTSWDDGPTDGLGAMVGAWWCDREARRTGQPMSRTDLMQDIAHYNEADCKVMMEIVRHLRQNH
jgi:hypothetical protein